MRSLRLLLAGWMVPLLGITLLAVGLLAYQSAGRLLVEREKASKDLMEIRRDERIKERVDLLDKDLLAQAQTLARLMQFQLDWGKFRHRELHLFGLVSITTADKGFVLIPGWTAPLGRGPVATEMYRRAVPEIRFNDPELQQHLDDVAEYFQVDTTWGSVFRSASLGQEEMSLDRKTFSPDEILHHEFDTTTLANGVEVRRVRLKAPAGRLVPFFGFGRRPSSGLDGRPGGAPEVPGRPTPGPGGAGRPGGGPEFPGRPSLVPGEAGRASPGPGRGGRPPGGPEGPGRPLPPERAENQPFNRPLVFIQCAYPLSRLEPAFDTIHEQYAQRVRDLQEESKRFKGALAGKLLVVGGATFGLALGGTIALVGWSLRPLKRLSEAVGKVSERDFSLRVEPGEFPSEIYPVCVRLRETLGQLERAFNREKQATADISHELRTPLASILTTLELALRRPRTAEEYRDLLETCKTSAGHMRGIVERLLTLARLDAGSDPVNTRPTNAAEVAEACAQMVRPVALARNIALEVEAPAPCWLSADPDKLREVVCNLLHNATQYNRSGGRVRLRVGQGEGTVVIEVSDTGIGIPPDQLDLIFERFHRVDPSRTGDGSNAGLGLSIVKAYVTLMGGAIAVESEPGRGTTFRLHLPSGKDSGSPEPARA